MKSPTHLSRITIHLILTMLALMLAHASPGEVVYSEDFDAGPGGWTPVNLTAVGIMWHQASYQGLGVAWCGTDNPDYVNPPGYGNLWIQTLSKTFTLPTGSPSLWFRIQFDTELNFDFWFAEISSDGGATFDVLHYAHGLSPGGGFYTYYSDLTAYSGHEVIIRFRFNSDGSYSDEDGIINTNGACRLDWVEVAGSRDDFTSDLDGWVPESIEPGGGPYRLETGLGGNPTPAWAAYDLGGPHAGEFHWTPQECRDQNAWVVLAIESPTILIPPDEESYFLEFDVYRDLPLCDWVFYDFEVATRNASGAWEWRSDIYIYYAPEEFPYWATYRVDLRNARIGWDYDLNQPIWGPLIAPGTLMIRVRLVGREYPAIDPPFCDQHPPGPFFDNVRLRIPGGPGTVAGHVIADCPTPSTPLYGVTLVAYDSDDAEVGTAVTDPTGAYEMSLNPGSYNLSLVTPLGYGAAANEYLVDVDTDVTTTQDFSLACLEIAANPRSIGYWKHQVSQALGGQGKGTAHKLNAAKGAGELSMDVDSPVCDYLDLIDGHFNSNAVNQVVVYEPPASGLCLDKLAAASTLLNLSGNQEMIARARQQLMALLLNTAAGYISLTEVISEDGATVSQAITHCDLLIDNALGDYEVAKTIADCINNGIPVPAGMIPLDTEQIAYRQGIPAGTTLLENVPNPFNPSTMIRFSLADARVYRVSIYDSGGRLVRVFDGEGRRGVNEILWDGTTRDGRRLGSGVYVSVLEADGVCQTGKMTLLK